MANPIRLFVVPSIGLEIECFDSSDRLMTKFGPTGKDPIRYKVKMESLPQNEAFSKLFTRDERKNNFRLEGWMSPISNVTLPSEVMKHSGIHQEAKYYAYIHPPEGLAGKIDWENIDNEGSEVTMNGCNQWAIPFCSVTGAYAYFTDDKLIQVNAISLLKTKYDLQLAGPFKVSREASTGMRELNRVHPCSGEVFFENSFVGFGVTCPGEMFRSTNIMEENNCGMHGTFIFYRDNGSALCYEIDSSGFIDPTGSTSVLHGVYECLTQRSKTGELKFNYIPNYKLPDVGSEEIIKKTIKRYCSQYDDDSILLEKLIDKITTIFPDARNTLIHEACRAQCDKNTVERLLGRKNSMLKIEDKIGWLPLHYACRFCHSKNGKARTSDFELIELLILRYPQAVVQPDKFNRCPLHIAIDSKASVRVIDLLLEHDPKEVALNCCTATLKRNPLHIACNRGVERDVFERILVSQKNNELLMSTTAIGCTPLQLAIQNKLDHEIIKMLIGSQRLTNSVETGIEVIDYENSKNDLVLLPFNGMIPLAHAVWRKSSHKSIEVLLDSDNENVTIDKTVEKENSHVTAGVVMQDIDGMVPLHLALKHCDAEVVALLLRKEQLKKRNNRYESTIFRRDKKMRCPLHIATQKSVDLNIVKELLALDDKKETTRALDSERCTPLHYACDSIGTNDNLVKVLLEGEKFYFNVLKSEEQILQEPKDWKPDDFVQNYEYRNAFVWHDRSGAHCLDKTNKSPLFHAVKSEASTDVITELLKPESLYLKGLDSLVDELAVILQKAEKTEMQQYLIDELSNRCYFCLMIFDISFHAIALITFIYSTEHLIEGNIEYPEITVLWFCIVIGIFREIVQLLSKQSSYFMDFWSWSEVVCLILLTSANLHFTSNIGVLVPDIDRGLLTGAGALLVVNLVFFLRTTFLPFARFVGGLLIIIQALIPFFIVSFLLLLAFAFSFQMSGTRGESCETLNACYLTVLQAFFAGAEGVEDYLDVLYGAIIIVVLLNVVIAIVEDAWEKAANVTIRLFWTYRLEFLSENRMFAKKQIKLLRGLENLLDNIGDIKFNDTTRWSTWPYNLVDEKEKYENPSGYFPEDIAGKIKDTYSCQASLHWVQKEYLENEEHSGGSQMKKAGNKANLFWGRFAVITHFLGRLVVYILLCILGIFTCGWFWPKRLRRKILSVGLDDQEEE